MLRLIHGVFMDMGVDTIEDMDEDTLDTIDHMLDMDIMEREMLSPLPNQLLMLRLMPMLDIMDTVHILMDTDTTDHTTMDTTERDPLKQLLNPLLMLRLMLMLGMVMPMVDTHTTVVTDMEVMPDHTPMEDTTVMEDTGVKLLLNTFPMLI